MEQHGGIACHWPAGAASCYLLWDPHVLDAGIPQRPRVCAQRPQHRAAAAQRRRRLAAKVGAAAAAAAAAAAGATAASAAGGVCGLRAAPGGAVQGGEAGQRAGDGVAGGEGDVLEAVQAEQRCVQLLLSQKMC
jgi:hypothetical protein